MSLSLWFLITSYFHIGCIAIVAASRWNVLMNKEKHSDEVIDKASKPYDTFTNLQTWFSIAYVIWYKWGF